MVAPWILDAPARLSGAPHMRQNDPAGTQKPRPSSSLINHRAWKCQPRLCVVKVGRVELADCRRGGGTRPEHASHRPASGCMKHIAAPLRPLGGRKVIEDVSDARRVQ